MQDQRAALDDEPPMVCMDCGRPADQPPGNTCANEDWHDPYDAPAPEVHLGVDLGKLQAVAGALHATWCPTAGQGCAYSVRDLQVALDASVAVRG